MALHGKRRDRRRPAGRAAALGVTGFAAMVLAAPGAHALTDASAPAETGDAAGSGVGKQLLQGPHLATATIPTPIYGSQKLRVSIEVKSGAFVPPGYSLAGATIQIVPSDAPPGSDPLICTTEADGSCFAGTLAPGTSAVITQLTAPVGPGLLVDPIPQTVQPCLVEEEGQTCGTTSSVPDAVDASEPASSLAAIADPASACVGPFCTTPVVFNDPGVPPQATADTGTVAAGASVTIPVTTNDTAGGAPTTIAVNTPPAHGTAVVAGATIVYTPTAPFGGIDTFTYTLTTANGSATANVAVTVKAPPVAVDDAARTNSGQAVTVDVLANDNPEGGGALSVGAVGAAAHGTATVSGTHVLYTPTQGFAGTDTFTYTATTANGSATATVTVTVVAVTAATGVPAQEILIGGAGLVGAGALLMLAAGRRRRHA